MVFLSSFYLLCTGSFLHLKQQDSTHNRRDKSVRLVVKQHVKGVTWEQV